MTTTSPALVRGLAALGLLALAACNNDPQSGGLIINYRFEPQNGVSCNQHAENVVEIQVEIGEGQDVVAGETVSCDNAGGEVVLAGVPAGTRDLFVYGIDADGDIVLDNLGPEDANDERVEIIGGGSKEIGVALGLSPARLEVGLVVENEGFPAQCASTELMIKGVRVQAWDNVNSELLKAHDFDLCDFAGYLPVPDDSRAIKGRRFDGVQIQPLDGAGNPVGMSSSIPFGGPVGAGKLVRLSVKCENQDQTCMVQVLGGNPGTTTDDPTGGDDPTGSDPSTGGGEDPTGGSDGADSTTG